MFLISVPWSWLETGVLIRIQLQHHEDWSQGLGFNYYNFSYE